jgi:hypothetical protein
MAKTPIMSADNERYMAFEGLVQWTQAVVAQSGRVRIATERLHAEGTIRNPALRREAMMGLHTEHHFFCISAHKVLEYRAWAGSIGLFAKVDFTEVDQFSAEDIRDLRNMREHVIDYFQGVGRNKPRWFVQTSQYRADASSVIGTLIGGRLDWVKFSAAAERLLPLLLAEPIP